MDPFFNKRWFDGNKFSSYNSRPTARKLKLVESKDRQVKVKNYSAEPYFEAGGVFLTSNFQNRNRGGLRPCPQGIKKYTYKSYERNRSSKKDVPMYKKMNGLKN